MICVKLAINVNGQWIYLSMEDATELYKILTTILPDSKSAKKQEPERKHNGKTN